MATIEIYEKDEISFFRALQKVVYSRAATNVCGCLLDRLFYF